MGKLTGKKAQVKVSGAAVTLTAEPTTDAGAHLVYQITNVAHRVLDPTAAITVYEDGVTSVAAHSVNRLNGTATFTVARGPAVVVTVSGMYLPLTAAIHCTEWSLNLSATNADVSDFDSAGWVERMAVSKDASGSVKSWRDTVDRTWENALIAGAPVVISLYTNSATNPDFLVWATLNKQQVQAALKSAQTQSIDFEGAADADNRVLSAA
jgi:hypothetical protein